MRRQHGTTGIKQSEYYVDRDRAAALAMGSKDIKRQMKKMSDMADIPQVGRQSYTNRDRNQKIIVILFSE